MKSRNGSLFEQCKTQFESDYKEITETRIKFIYWKNIDTTNVDVISAMAYALIGSEQQFVDFKK